MTLPLDPSSPRLDSLNHPHETALSGLTEGHFGECATRRCVRRVASTLRAAAGCLSLVAGAMAAPPAAAQESASEPVTGAVTPGPVPTAGLTVVPAVDSITAPIDGVLMLPLREATGPEDPGDADIPDRLTVRFGDGPALEGLVAIVVPVRPAATGAAAAARLPAGWTDVPPRIEVLSPAAAREAGRRGTVVLLLRTPAEAPDGPLQLGQADVSVRWLPWRTAYAGRPLPGIGLPRLPRDGGPDRPDPEDPLEYWRWVLLADEIGWRPPPPPGNERTARLAEHVAANWRMGLGRLGAEHPGVASALRDALTLRVDRTDGERRDRSTPRGRAGRIGGLAASSPGRGVLAAPRDPALPPSPLAAWRTDPVGLEQVLSWLLDPRMPMPQAVGGILGWIESAPPILAWRGTAGATGRATGDLHLMNRSDRPVNVRLAWETTANEQRELVLPPRSVDRVAIRRPPARRTGVGSLSDVGNAGSRPNGSEASRPDGSALTPRPGGSGAADRLPPPSREPGLVSGSPQALLVEDAKGHTIRLVFGAPWITARPPGVDLMPRPRMTLADVEAGRQLDPFTAIGAGCNARIRRRGGRWELFIECRRPPVAPATIDEASGAVPPAAPAADDLVRVWLGPVGSADVLTIPESGPVGLERRGDGVDIQTGSGGSGAGSAPPPPPLSTPPVFRRSWPDRWFARVVLPDELVRDGILAVGLSRTAGDAVASATAPGPVPGWRRDPGRVHVDLGDWDGR